MISIKLYGGFDLNELELLGSGTQGKVYRISSDKCIKVFKKREACKAEIESLIIAQSDVHFPRLYSFGDKYIIRECINGIPLDDYLKKHPLNEKISLKIVSLYEAMAKIGYRRLDTALFHIFITQSGYFKLIDPAKAMKKKAIYPRLIISGLKELGYKDEFLSFVKKKRPELYNSWIKYIKGK